MNTMKKDIDTIIASYLDMIQDSQEDVNSAYENATRNGGNMKDYFAALERHKTMSEGVAPLLRSICCINTLKL